MKLHKEDMLELSQIITRSVVAAIKELNLYGDVGTKPKEKTAYQKTEQLLYNYNSFKRIVEERYAEIEDIKLHGVPKQSGAVVVYSGNCGEKGLVLPQETVQGAVCRIMGTVQDTVQVIDLMDKCMASMKSDPYYKILEMRYFEGRTQEDIAVEFGCSQVTISKNKNRLINELALRLFPNQVAQEMME